MRSGSEIKLFKRQSSVSGVSSTSQCLLLPPGHRSPNQRAFKTLLWEGMPADRSQVLHLTGRQSINGPGPRASPQPITDPCLLRAQAFLWEWVPHCQTQTEPTVVLLAFPTVLPHPGLRSPQGDSVNQKGSNVVTNPACNGACSGHFKDAKHCAESFVLNPEALLSTAATCFLWLEMPALGELSGSLRRQGLTQCCPLPNVRKGDECSTSGHGQLHSQISRQ